MANNDKSLDPGEYSVLNQIYANSRDAQRKAAVEASNNSRNTSKATSSNSTRSTDSSWQARDVATSAAHDKATQEVKDKNERSASGLPKNSSIPSSAIAASDKQYEKKQKEQMEKKYYGEIHGNSPGDVAIRQDSIDKVTPKNKTHVDVTNTKPSISAVEPSLSPAKEKAKEEKKKKAKNIEIGDKVQIKDGGIDVLRGEKAVKGKMYGKSGPYWLTVTGIVKDYSTGSKFGLPAKVTLVKCSDRGMVLWQVADTDISSQTIKKSEAAEDPVYGQSTGKRKDGKDPNTASKNDAVQYTKNPNKRKDYAVGASNNAYAPDSTSEKWYVGFDSNPDDINKQVQVALKNNATISDSVYDDSVSQLPAYVPITTNETDDKYYWNDKQYRAMLLRQGYDKYQIDQMVEEYKSRAKNKTRLSTGAVMKAEYLTNWNNDGRKAELLNDKTELIQNQYGFPFKTANAVYDADDVNDFEDAIHNLSNVHDIKCAKYNYQIILDDDKLKNGVTTFEDRLCDARASLGIPVHGSKKYAKSMKMYMYNRFKVPDTNLALSRTITHVFFTRPDLNILDESSFTANWQTRNHTDSALIWKTHPELFKLLTDYRRCGDHDNFNLLLSNNVTSFTIDDEKINTNSAGQSWAKHEIVYGDQYTGRTADTFQCTFAETADLSIIHLMKLWVTYIDNISRGAWSPYYYTTDGGMTVKNKKTDWCHVYDRALDYAASVYVFVCGPDGEDVLYWSKYYGVFPTTTGSGALTWNNGNIDPEKVNITFSYSCKKDLSPVSLLEFNTVANTAGSMYGNNQISNVPSFDGNVAGSTRPFVGSPYIEIDLGEPTIGTGDDVYNGKETHIRLKYRYPDKYSNKDGNQLTGFKDAVLYRTHYSSDKTENATA